MYYSALQQYAVGLGHVTVLQGMNRLLFSPAGLPRFVQVLFRSYPHVRGTQWAITSARSARGTQRAIFGKRCTNIRNYAWSQNV